MAEGASGLDNLNSSHTRRVRVMVYVISVIAVLITTGWALFFALRGDFLVAVADGAMLAVGVAAIYFTLHQRLRTAVLILLSGLLIRLAGFALFLDLPSADILRSIHHFMIPIGVAAYLMLRGESGWLQHGIALISLACVVFFTSTDFGIASQYAVPDSVRRSGTWLNNFFSALVLLSLLGLFVSDIDRVEGFFLRLYWRLLRQVCRMLPPLIPRARRKNAAAGLKRREKRGSDKPIAPIPLPSRSQLRRVHLMVLFSSGVMILLGAALVLFFAFYGKWFASATNLTLVILGLALNWVERNGRSRSATLVLVSGLFLVCLVNTAVLDIPSAHVPRASHYYFLVLALATYFLLQYENNWLHQGIPILCLLAFVWLASTPSGIATSFILRDDHRPPAWLIGGIALGVMHLLVHILVGDISRMEAFWHRLSKGLAGTWAAATGK